MKNQKKESPSAARRWKFRLLLLVLFLIGWILAFVPWEGIFNLDRGSSWRFLAETVTKLGDALMIAPILAMVVEIAAQGELLDSFVENVSTHIIGHLLPKQLRQHLFSYLAISFVRTRWFVEVGLEPDFPVSVKATVLIQYELENCSYSKQTYRFRYMVDPGLCSNGNENFIKHVRAMANDEILLEYSSSTEPTVDQKVHRDEGTAIFSQELRIPPQPHGIYQFLAESVQTLPIKYSLPFTTQIPVLQTTIRVLYPKDKLEADLNLSFADKTVLVQTELISGREWVVDSTMLPGHSFFVTWKVASTPTPAQPSRDDRGLCGFPQTPTLP